MDFLVNWIITSRASRCRCARALGLILTEVGRKFRSAEGFMLDGGDGRRRAVILTGS
jgi:hypothetical protein